MTEQQFQSLRGDFEKGIGAILHDNRCATEWVGGQLAQIAKANRKERRTGTVACVVALRDRLSIVQSFDNQPQEIKDLTLNLIPDFTICQIEFKGLCKNITYFGLYFKTADFWVIGNKEKLTGRWLYEAFARNGVVFNLKISKNKAAEALLDFFLPKIYSAENKLTIPALAGWNKGLFMSKETFAFREAEGLPVLPVQKKSLQKYENELFCWEEYFVELRRIADWRDRCWIMIYPIIGMVGSILEEKQRGCSKYLNFVMLTDTHMRIYYRYFQIFNRYKLAAQDPTIANAKEAKDEILILNACPDEMVSVYKQNQTRKRCQGLAEKIIRREIMTDDGQCVCIPVVVFSDQIAESRYAVNIFVDDSFFTGNTDKLTNLEHDAQGGIFGRLIGYFEEHYEEVEEMANMEVRNREIAWLEIAYDMAKKFWEDFDVDMELMAGFPRGADIQSLWDDTLQIGEDIISDYISIIRMGVSDWTIKEKQYGRREENCIVYDEEYIMFPTDIFAKILQRFGITTRMRRKFLVELRAKCYLKTDNGTSLSRQIQVGNKCVEMYQIQRKLFERIGLPDIIDLGKEEAN